MMTREEYLERGVEWVAHDHDRASVGQLAPTARKDPETYGAKCEAAATQAYADLAPTITLEDMPHDMAPRRRERLLSEVSKGLSEDDLADISRRALALEMHEPLLYWQKAEEDCVPILRNQAQDLGDRFGEEQAGWSIMHTNWTADHINEQAQSRTYLRGSKDTIDMLASTACDWDADYSTEERKTLFSHLILHSRVGARANREFDKASKRLGQEAAPVVALIEEGGLAAGIMARADYLGRLPKADFAQELGREQTACLAAIQGSGAELSGSARVGSADTMLQDRVRGRACAQMVKQSAEVRPENSNFMELHRRTNAALLQEAPLGSGPQVAILAAELARMRMETRELERDKRPSTSRSGAAEK